ncbi:MAG: ABC transporter transmembrane domain-containing protein [Kiritimatiellia bacterium]|nr:ABC transporter transmembrane domain-containing protein [Kiritimatiellia bacterium]
MSSKTSDSKSEKKAVRGVYRRLIGYTRPYLGRLVTGGVFCVLFAGSTTGMIYGAREFFGRVFNPLEHGIREVALAAALLIAMGLGRGIGDFLGRFFLEWVGNRVVMDLRNAMFGRLQDLSLDYFSKSRTGELISRLSNDAAMVERSVAQVLADLFKQPVVLLGACTALLWLNFRLAILMLTLFPICILPIALFGRRVRRSARLGQERLADLLSIAQEAITGARIVRAFGGEEIERSRFARQSREVFRRLMQVTRSRIAVEPIIVELGILGVSLVLIYSWKVQMPVGDFFAFALALMLLYDPVKRLGNLHMVIEQSCAAAERIFEIIDAPITVSESPEAKDLEEEIREIRFEEVAFAYDSTPVLQDIDLTVQAGECVAFVGSSGAGKTTLVGLVPRFSDVTRGRLTLNGRDVRELTLRSLRGRIGVVTQDTFLFNETVAENIAYGRPETSRADIEAAARRAYAHEFILEMPEGYDTVVGERGVRLSGGQRQRLAIARALLRNPPILILDEATSALDTESERLVQAALEELMVGRTVLVIAHRLSTIMRATRIVVLDKGRIAETGRHEELLARNGIYRRLYDLQFP